jgi:serine/threonine-protein kinase
MNLSRTAGMEDDLSGRTLGGYRLVRRLGSGGMGDVYLGEQLSLGRPVAVKVLRAETARHRDAVERFGQEARAAAALAHGNIVQIHEVACIDGIHFLAEEYVAGPSLAAWLALRGPLDPRQGLAVLRQVGAALARAADRGIVHRDIKPENLLVTPAGEVKVADFGLARVLADDLSLTRTGMTVGTPLYMSPEQAQGQAVDARSDLYSLGATVYHLLAGRPPFTGPTGVSVVMGHLTKPPEPLAAVRPDLPPAVAGIVDRLLAKDPAERFASPHELVQAVDEAAAALGPGPGPAALAWEGAVEAWRTADQRATDPPGLRAATEHLRAVTAHEAMTAADDRLRARRRWLGTAVAATAAAAIGFLIGRLRPRRAEFRRPR